MNLENIRLSRRSQTEGHVLHDSVYLEHLEYGNHRGDRAQRAGAAGKGEE